MSHDVYYQFLQHPDQARRAGARGGKATVRNRRERLDRTPAEMPEPEAEAAPPGPFESTAAAIALLDVQYPWLRGAEKRFLHRSHRAGGTAHCAASQSEPVPEW
jgi:hypothetical protein